MSGYLTRSQTVSIRGALPLSLTLLKDNQQFHDPLGQAQALGVCSASWPLFGLLWPSSIRLAQKIAQRKLCKTERILELGCGLGLASLVAHRQGRNITASDRHPLAQKFLLKNTQANQLPPIPYKYAQWGQPCYAHIATEQGLRPLQSQFDLIMASDVLYERSMAQELAHYVHQHAKPVAEVWVIDPNRGYAGAFTRALEQYGFSMRENRLLSQDRLPNGYGQVEVYNGRFLSYQRV